MDLSALVPDLVRLAYTVVLFIVSQCGIGAAPSRKQVGPTLVATTPPAL